MRLWVSKRGWKCLQQSSQTRYGYENIFLFSICMALSAQTYSEHWEWTMGGRRRECLFDALLVPSLSLRYRPDNSLKFPTPCSLISGTVSPEQHHHYPWLFLGREQYNKHWSSVDILYSSGCTKWDWGLHIIWIAIQTNRPQRLQSWSEGGGGGGLVRSWFWGGRNGWGATLKVH